jgi:hypothetical protein
MVFAPLYPFLCDIEQLVEESIRLDFRSSSTIMSARQSDLERSGVVVYDGVPKAVQQPIVVPVHQLGFGELQLGGMTGPDGVFLCFSENFFPGVVIYLAKT